MLVARGVPAAVGGFRETRKFVDAGLLAAVRAAGGIVYRSHGHGYVLRRGGEGHTWDPGLGYFVSRRAIAGTSGGGSGRARCSTPMTLDVPGHRRGPR